ncbi:nucleoside deaminase [Dissulfurirhabdus thermomarina]|uniref:tRNA-specific adenosine deaminase n=2 Tax=Dissulfurirhabdus thermomarina TaxID=1765737 RepID=A0A6N9TKB7_DISTH|nr:nucleoside deaminase [Dissulfurirhabdus thermomarina]NMX24065.1 nucleoside deaminase [Dissulfurirhabdus thermomarina]
MRMALREAEAAAGRGEVPVGAVLVDAGGEVLAAAGNAPVGTGDPTAHAEVLALREGARRTGNYRLTGTTLYVTIEPCPMCAGALVHARVRRLVFGADDPRAGACGTLYNVVQDPRLNHRVEVTRGVLAGPARELIQAFFRARRAAGGQPDATGGEVPKRS